MRKFVFFLVCISFTVFLMVGETFSQLTWDPEIKGVTPTSVTGRVLPLPLAQSEKRIELGWEISDEHSGSTHYCIYYKKTDSPPTGNDLNNQPCYDYTNFKDTDSMTVKNGSDTGTGPNGRDMWYVTISNLDYEKWYIFQITANKNPAASCGGCDSSTIESDNASFPKPFRSYGVYVPKSSLKWEEYTE